MTLTHNTEVEGAIEGENVDLFGIRQSCVKWGRPVPKY